ncbi:prolyl oligopeptidase family serine peptidase [Maribacter sp. 2307ULW6-5]|uniref:prolyl oligopeptidase family serine peptidase n=1 Tax=Maribacter sp. 2307ULW6-5 TaxID=3386275 RepID=UPI0039BD8545
MSMKWIPLYASVLVLILVLACAVEPRDLPYPKIENVQQVESSFGITYVNVFLNLEDYRNKDVVQWFNTQDSLAEFYFSSDMAFQNYRERIRKYENTGSGNVSDLKYDERFSTYFLKDTLTSRSLYKLNNRTGAEELLFDPGERATTEEAIIFYKPSYDGKHIALALGKDSDFFQTIVIYNVASKKTVASVRAQVKPKLAGGIVWSPDSKSILFIAYPNQSDDDKTDESFMARYDLDNPDGEITAILQDGDLETPINEEFFIMPKVRSEKDNYIFAYIANANDHWDCYYITKQEFSKRNYRWKKLFDDDDRVLYDYGTERNHLFFYKRVRDDRIQLSQMDLRDQHLPVKVLYEGEEEDQLANFKVVRDAVFFTVSKNGIQEQLFKINPNAHILPIPLPKTPGEITMKYRSPYMDELYLQLNGWTINYENYKVLSDDSVVKQSFPIRSDYPEFANIVSQVIEVPSHDGTLVPVSIVHQKDFEKNKGNKAILSVYGAYGISETPWFHEPILDFVNQGNVYGIAHVRGGGEKGPEWHDQGRMLNKPNSWKDLNHAARYLIDHEWVHPKKIGLNANSAGAIAAAMAVNTEPGLYGALTLFNGAVNDIRSESIPGFDTTDNMYEFGSGTDSIGLRSLVQLDPVVNFNADVSYPSTLLIMGYEDYMVPPSANGKFMALIQTATKKQDRSYLLDVNFELEHEIDWYADYAKAFFFMDKELERQPQ